MTAIAHRPHPVTRAVAGVRDRLTEVAGVPLWSMGAGETGAVLDDLLRAEAQLSELKARLVSHAEAVDLPGRTAAKSTAHWLAHRATLTGAEARRTTRMAAGLEQHEHTREALVTGRIHVEQAAVVLRALADLPDGLDGATVERAERHLLAEAALHDAKALQTLGRRLLEVIDPDAAEAHEARVLEREERDAQAAARLVMWDDGHGKLHGRFTLPALEGAMLTKAVLALAAPRHRAARGRLGERRPSPERLGRAFAELIAGYPVSRLPRAGGLNATVVVTMTLDALLGGLKAAQLDTGESVSASLARRLACETGIIPAVLGGRSQVLDLGRRRRFHNQAQRIVASLEQRGCAAEGCDEPPGRTQLHHPVAWSRGGETNRDAIMLCAWDHARAHDPRYEMTLPDRPGGNVTFHRRT